jgi:hypothetical protein
VLKHRRQQCSTKKTEVAWIDAGVGQWHVLLAQQERGSAAALLYVSRNHVAASASPQLLLQHLHLHLQRSHPVERLVTCCSCCVLKFEERGVLIGQAREQPSYLLRLQTWQRQQLRSMQQLFTCTS